MAIVEIGGDIANMIIRYPPVHKENEIGCVTM